MFDTLTETTEAADVSADMREQRILECERIIGQLRAIQAQELSVLDGQQVATGDGARTLVEWTAARFDLSRTTASDLVLVARSEHQDINSALAEGDISFDRATNTLRLANSGYEDALERTAGYDIGGLKRLRVTREPLSGGEEEDIYQHRSLALQPRLDESAYTGWLTMAGPDAKTVETALMRRAEQLRRELPDGTVLSRGQLLHDSLVDMATDDLNTTNPGTDSPGTVLTVFVDQAPITSERAGSGQAAGEHQAPVVQLDNGIRIGPNALQQLICGGASVELDADTQPLGIGRASKTIPPRLKRWVMHRDQGVCSISGCDSTYRLEAHHIIPWYLSGRTDADNLATLCWFHHHVAIHRHGFQIDLDSPPLARRFHRKPPIHGPP